MSTATKEHGRGTFSQPEFVVCDTTLLSTLPSGSSAQGWPRRSRRASSPIPRLSSGGWSAVRSRLRRNRALLEEIVTAAIRVKADIVERDEREERRAAEAQPGPYVRTCHREVLVEDESRRGGRRRARCSRPAGAVKLGLLLEEACGRIERALSGLGFQGQSPVEPRKRCSRLWRGTRRRTAARFT